MRSAVPLEFFGAENLAIIERTCAAWMARLGYAPSVAGP